MSSKGNCLFLKLATNTLCLVIGGLSVYGYIKYFNTSTDQSSSSERDTGLIENDKDVKERSYEQESALNEYLLMHFGEDLCGQFIENVDENGQVYYSIVTDKNNDSDYGNFASYNINTKDFQRLEFPSNALNFPKRVAELAKSFTINTGRALDLGCAVGRTAFELSSLFDKVLGIDFSHAFVNAATELAKGQEFYFHAPIEGSVTVTSKATLGSHTHPENCTFEQGDATNLNPSLGKFDCVVGANLVDRLPKPKRFLESISEFLNKDGILVLTSPYTWLSQYTHKSDWLGGYEDENGHFVSTFETIFSILTSESQFELVHQSHMPFLIRETARKNQFTYAHVTVWKKI